MASATSSNITRTPVSYLMPAAKNVIDHALSSRTKTLYLNYWQRYCDFCQLHHIVITLPVSEVNLVNFLGHLVTVGLKANTIASHASALAYINKYLGYTDFSNSFLVKQFFKGCNTLSAGQAGPDTRLPITYNLFGKIIEALPYTIQSLYNRILFSTMCILAFHGFLRISELCAKNTSSNHAIKTENVHVLEHEGGIQGIQIQLQTFKHSRAPVTLLLPRHLQNSRLCPYVAVKTYQTYFTHKTGPFFKHLNGTPVSYSFFNENLRNTINFLGFDPAKYKSHSFRIGAATSAAIQGYSEDVIKRMGRWNSNALQNYIRMPQLQLTNV